MKFYKSIKGGCYLTLEWNTFFQHLFILKELEGLNFFKLVAGYIQMHNNCSPTPPNREQNRVKKEVKWSLGVVFYDIN